jgi:predicted DNA-binding protein (UPF0251 family)
MLCSVCGLPDVPECEGGRDDNPLAALDFENLVTAVLFISGRIIARGGMKGRGLAYLNNREAHDLMLRTAAVFEGWPDRFYDLLEYERSRWRHPWPDNAVGMFGKFSESLFAHAGLSHASLNFFRLGFASYLELREIGHWAKKVKLNLKYLTRRAAAKRLGVDWRTMQGFISEGRLKTVTRKGWQREQILVEAESVEKLRAELGQLLGTKEVAERLGVSPYLLSDMVAAGVLKAVRGSNIDGYKYLKFNRRDVENLMRNITSRLPEYDPLFKHCPGLWTAVKKFGQPKWGLIKTIKAILADSLLPESGSPETKPHSPR